MWASCSAPGAAGLTNILLDALFVAGFRWGLVGAAAALHFDCPEDEQSVELMGKIKAEGVEKALAEYTGLQENEPLFGRILDVYRALASAKSHS